MLVGRILTVVVILAGFFAFASPKSFGQAFGVELQASLMPASGGMGGAGIARPQDLQSALALNPATLTQMKGTRFSFGGAWVEPTINVDNNATLPLANITPFEAKSRRPGSVVGNIGVTQDFNALGMPVTAGIGLLTASGLGINYRDAIESNGTSAEMVVLQTGAGAGVQLTDRLSLGFLGLVGTGTMDGIFTGVSSATPAYNLRGILGASYDVTDTATIGGFWHTQQKFTFDDFVRFGGPGNAFQDFVVSLPQKFGIGVADQSLLGGKLLVAVDLTWFRWSQTDFFSAIWDDQLAVQTGFQYTTEKGCKFRVGYAFAENASRSVIAPSLGGITPQASVDYIQSLFPNINRHRLTGGIGMTDVLPGVDVDLFAGGAFEDSQSFGLTSVSAEIYWVGFGTTWRFGRGACCQSSVPSRW